MSESFSKVKLAEEAVMSRHRDLQAGEVELSGQRSDLERREAALREGEAEIVREREQIQEIVRCYQLEAAQVRII